MFPKDLYIDLGTENTRIYAKRKGILLNQPTIIAHSKKINLEVTGEAAKKMIGRAPTNYSVHKPMQKGVVKDFEYAKDLLTNFLKDAKNEMLFSRSRILISLPIEVDKEEKEMFRALAYELGAGTVHLVSEPMAGAVGTGKDIFSKKPSMFLDLGAGTSEIIVTANGRISYSEAVRVGGNDINSAIIEVLKSEHHFSVGEQTAEFIKKETAVLDLNSIEARTCKASGLNLKTGFPENRVVDSTMIQSALIPTFDRLSKLLCDKLDQWPSEIISDVKKSGVIVFGGGSLIGGTAQHFSKIFDAPFIRANNPLMSVAIGGSKILDNDQLFKNLKL